MPEEDRWESESRARVEAHFAALAHTEQGKRRIRQAAGRRYPAEKRGPCAQQSDRCKGPIELHHEDYTKPFDVVFLCRYHHRRLHKPRGPRG